MTHLTIRRIAVAPDNPPRQAQARTAAGHSVTMNFPTHEAAMKVGVRLMAEAERGMESGSGGAMEMMWRK